MTFHRSPTTPPAADDPIAGVHALDWVIDADRSDAWETTLAVDTGGDEHIVTATLRALEDADLAAAVRVACPQGFAVALFSGGVLQRTNDLTRWATSPTALDAFYTMDPASGSVAVTPDQTSQAIVEWIEGVGSAVAVLVTGTLVATDPTIKPGGPVYPGLMKRERLRRGETREISLRIAVNARPFPLIYQDACDIPDGRDAATHAIALWGSQVPSLGTLELQGSAYPTIHSPRREYGALHTFFDPDAWSVVASLSYSGVEGLQRQARDVLERSLSRITPEGLVPHHFDGDVPVFVAISGSPQPGPNVFLLEASIDHACATGDFAWLRQAWDDGLRAASTWLLAQRDPRTGLLDVEGALWVDVFRRKGLTLDTNAMVVRTFARVAQLARYVGDNLSPEFEHASAAARAGLERLWAGDHFATSLNPDDGTVEDHIDAENYLAVAVGAAADDRADAIIRLFDDAPQTHPGGRGTWVSLRRYDGEDCYQHNTGDSDIAMARLWWADLLARRSLRDRARFDELYEPVRSDLLELIWMRERYSAGGHMTRARGYHEYPGILDMMLREGRYGIALDVLAAEVSPMRSEPFTARFGAVRLDYSVDHVVLDLPGDSPRTVTIHGMVAGAAYAQGAQTVIADEQGVVRISAQPVRNGVRVDIVRQATQD